jgi:16S rRNA C967 or C1407 C5-methylase (RsmB/RsmF family)
MLTVTMHTSDRTKSSGLTCIPLRRARQPRDTPLVYSTCSLEPEESDAMVAGFTREDITPFVPEGAREWVSDGAPESGADGFTAYVLRRP